MKKKLIAIMLILSIIIPLIPTNIVISSAASDTDKYKTWDKMTFSTSSSSSTGNKVAVVSQMVGWHYSGGYWKFTAYGSTSSIEIRDKQMTDIMEGYLESEALSKYIEVEADLPSNIKTYLKNSGSIENINISFDSGKMDPDKIYDGTIYYTINKTKEKIIIAFKPKFNVSGEPILHISATSGH